MGAGIRLKSTDGRIGTVRLPGAQRTHHESLKLSIMWGAIMGYPSLFEDIEERRVSAFNAMSQSRIVGTQQEAPSSPAYTRIPESEVTTPLNTAAPILANAAVVRRTKPRFYELWCQTSPDTAHCLMRSLDLRHVMGFAHWKRHCIKGQHILWVYDVGEDRILRKLSRYGGFRGGSSRSGRRAKRPRKRR